MIRRCEEGDSEAIYEIVNDAAQAYRGVIPADRWHEPYMPREELRREIEAGVVFWGYEAEGELVGVMGIQDVGDVTLIRHAYVRAAWQRRGVGGKLLRHLCGLSEKPILIGTWADAEWAVRFYQKHGFRLVTREEKDRLLRKYWSIPARQVETSVVLAGPRWFESSRSKPEPVAHRFLSPVVHPWGLLSVATVLACVATLAGLLGRVSWLLELASHFRVQYLCVLLLGGAAFAVRRKWWSLGFTAGFAVVNLFLVLPLYLGPAPPAGAGPDLRALLINVNVANRQYETVAEYIASASPDVIVLLEVNENWLSQLGALREEYPFWIQAPRRGNFGIALLSRLPVTGAIRVIGDVPVPSIAAQVDVHGRRLRLVAIHVLPPAGAANAACRRHQLRALGELAGSWSDAVVVLGDLNCTPWSPLFRDLLREGKLMDGRKGYGIKPSWPAGLPLLWIPIDQCLVSDRIEVKSFTVGPDVGSDHYPVLVELSLPPPVGGAEGRP